MRFRIKAQSLTEFIGAKLNLVPLPAVRTKLYAHYAKTGAERQVWSICGEHCVKNV